MRRLSDGDSREMESGPTVGTQRVGECAAVPGLECLSASGSRRMNKRRNPCLSPSLYRPDEIPYSRPPWRYELDQWISPYGKLLFSSSRHVTGNLPLGTEPEVVLR